MKACGVEIDSLRFRRRGEVPEKFLFLGSPWPSWNQHTGGGLPL